MLIELKNVIKGFQFGDTYLPVLTDVNLNINPGDRVHLKGRNGAGKTTLLRIIAGDIKPDSGEVVKNCDEHEIAFLSQAIPMYVGRNLTVAEHISLGFVNRSNNPVKHAVNAYNLESIRGFISEFGIGLENRLFDFVGNLSGGESQLIGLATVLAIRPKVLCLDEPSASLDYRVVDTVASLLRRLPYQSALIFTAHNGDFSESIKNKVIEL